MARRRGIQTSLRLGADDRKDVVFNAVFYAAGVVMVAFIAWGVWSAFYAVVSPTISLRKDEWACTGYGPPPRVSLPTKTGRRTVSLAPECVQYSRNVAN
jgi:hypothetical protein